MKSQCLAVFCAVVLFAPVADAKGSKKGPPVVGMVSEGIAERLHTPKKKKKGNAKAEVGKTFTAVCDGSVASWKVSDLGDDGAWVGGFVNGGYKPKHCMLLDAPSESAMAAKGRPNATPAQINAAKAAATVALTPKKGEAPTKVELAVFHDGEGFVAVASTTHPAGEKSNCLDHSSLVVLSETEDGKWKEVFRPSAKTKATCGYQFFTRGDIDADGKDEIALRVDLTDGYAYRVLKRAKKGYDVVVK